MSALARAVIYSDKDLETIERDIEQASQDPDLQALEQNRHGLESLLHLFKGIEAHKKANQFHGGAWQVALVRQKGHPERDPKDPETLTRQEVAEEFDAFPFREQLLNFEQETLRHYGDLLELNDEPTIELSNKISLQRSDIQALINDINVRIAERIPDDDERKAKLQELDDELAEIIKGISDEDWGKRFELEEIYLLRRLIHSIDTGHLVAVSHGTPREDLRPDRGSVDIGITAAGDDYDFQLKTFKYGVSGQTREQQRDILDKARRSLEGQSTHLVVLETEMVEDAYERALRQSKRASTSRADKYAALEPITNEISVQERSRLLTVLGLTEQDLTEEQEAFDERQAELRAHQDQIREREEERRVAEEEVVRRKTEERQQQEEEERAREEAIRTRIELSRTMSEAARQREGLAKDERAEERRARKRRERELLEAQVAQRKAEENERAEKEAKREADRLRRKRKKEEGPGWPPKNLSGLFTVPVLQALELLPKDWDGDARALLDAKKHVIALVGKPKKKDAAATESDRPNPQFKKLFPSKELLESPTEEVLRQLRDLLDKK